MFKIAFILPNLLTGGSQRVILNLIDECHRLGHFATLIVINKEKNSYHGYEEDFVHNLERREAYEYVNLGCSRVIEGLLPLRRELLTKGYTHCISTLTYVNIIALASLYFTRKKPKLFIRESNLVSKRFNKNILFRLAIRLTYNSAEGIICQSAAMLKDLSKYTNTKGIVIYNPVDVRALSRRSKTNWRINRNNRNIVMLGHMTSQKNYHLALSTLRLLDEDFILHIIGRKLELQEFLGQITKFGLEDRVKLYGFQENPHEILSECDVFLMTSRYEGLPNALLEAGVLGLPIVTTNFFDGLNDLLPSYGTTIVDSYSPNEIAQAIVKVEKADLNKTSISDVYMKKFSVQNILREYLEFIQCETH